VNGEDAVRSYLAYLDDPSNIRDDSEIASRRRAVAEAVDPVQKLRAMAALDQAEAVDGSAQREGFIREARRWAKREGIRTSAFVEIGVPLADLRAAGFEVPGGRTRRSSRGRRPNGQAAPRRRPGGGRGRGAGRTSRSRVTADSVRDAILSTSRPFTTSEVQKMTGGSLGTIRKVLGELVETGQVGELGPDRNRGRRGRAPIRYQRA